MVEITYRQVRALRAAYDTVIESSGALLGSGKQEVLGLLENMERECFGVINDEVIYLRYRRIHIDQSTKVSWPTDDLGKFSTKGLNDSVKELVIGDY